MIGSPEADNLLQQVDSELVRTVKLTGDLIKGFFKSNNFKSVNVPSIIPKNVEEKKEEKK